MQSLLNKAILIVLLLPLCIGSSGQIQAYRQDILKIDTLLHEKTPGHLKRSYLYRGEQSVFKKYNPVSLLLGGSMYVYQNVLSKHISASCLYTPGCSDFSKEAIREYGLLKGVILSADRLNRCNRIAAQDLRHYNVDEKANRYPDPVSKYKREKE